MDRDTMAAAINRVLRAVLDGSEPRYRYEDAFIRWGLVETDLVDAALAASSAGLARVEGERKALVEFAELVRDCPIAVLHLLPMAAQAALAGKEASDEPVL